MSGMDDPGVYEAVKKIEHHLLMIVRHKNDPCEFWTGRGCEISMHHDAEEALNMVYKLVPRPEYEDAFLPETAHETAHDREDPQE